MIVCVENYSGLFFLDTGGLLILFDEASWSTNSTVVLHLNGICICSILTFSKEGTELVKELREVGVLE